MIDLKNAYEIRNVLNNKVIDKIEDELGNIWYEAFKILPASGVPPITLQKCKGVDLVDYKIYGESVQDGTPTPNAPIEIQSVGEKSKNLFDINKVELTQNCEIIDNGIKFTGGGSFDIPLKAGQYTISFKNNGIGTCYLRNGKVTSGYISIINKTDTSKTFNFTADVDGYLRLSCFAAGQIFSDIQIEEGTVATEYESYGYRLPIKARGKNLIEYPYYDTTKTLNGVTITDNGDGTLTLNGTATTNFTFNIISNRHHMWDGLKKDNTYTISLQTEGNYSGPFSLVCNYYYDEYSSYTAWLAANTNKSTTKLIPEDMIGLRSYLYIYSGATFENTIIRPQLELGETATDFEPYKEPATANIYLKEPLRKVGDVADCIDFEKGLVIRKIYQGQLIDVIKSSMGSQYANGLCRRQGTVNPRADYNIAPMSNCLKGNKVLNAYANNISFVSSYSNGYVYFNAIDVGLEPVTSTITNTTIGTAINNYITEHNIDLVYVLAEPDDTEIIELPNIPTHKGTTIIEVDTNILPSNMEVKYYRKE